MSNRVFLVLAAFAIAGTGTASAAPRQQAAQRLAAQSAPSPSKPGGPLTQKPAAPPALPGPVSSEAALLVEWVALSGDNDGRPFMVIDKRTAELLIYDSKARPLGRAPVLIGIAKGDDSAPGIGQMDLGRIPVNLRTTPAGRFLSHFGPAKGYKGPVLWVDEANAVSLHPVITTNPAEKRLARLQSSSPRDNRITYGCINVDAKLYATLLEPLFRQVAGVVYILPERRPIEQVFAGIPPEKPAERMDFAAAFSAFGTDADVTGNYRAD